jgi:hypothetical protein
VTLTATTDKNCVSSREETIDLGVKPVADFYWKNECMHQSDSIMLFDTTFSTSVIASRSWNFFDGGPLLTEENPKYPQNAPGYLNVEYIVRTNYHACHDTITKSIYIRPTIDSLFTDDYFENFESGNGSWVKDYEIKNSWSFGTPGRIRINKAFSGINSWYTNYPYTNQKPEASSIISPCFDFTGIDRPMIKMMLWKKFDRNRDGAALQYKIGDTPGWQYVGTLEDGINWYNSTLIKGRPGGDQIGWTEGTTAETNWSEAKHKLDELEGKKDVKFRVVYGSDGTSQDNDGIAFDDIWIGSRTRGVFVEHFANNPAVQSGNATADVTDFVNRGAEDIINIQYHTNFPGPDPYYDANPGDASARFLFYGLSRAPFTLIDGGTRTEYANTFDHFPVPNLDTNDVIRRSLKNPLFLININASVAGGILSVTGTLKALDDSTVTNMTLYIAVTQKRSSGPAGSLGETEYYNVFRKFIPDAGGLSLKKSWTKDEVYNLTEKTWTINNIPNASDIEVIVLLQNNLTKEVYQAESVIKPNIIVGIDNMKTGRGEGFSVYPNPSSGRLVLTFGNILKTETEVRIYDFSGTLKGVFKAEAGEKEYVIENLGLAEGIYLVRATSGGLDLGYKKLIVAGR